MNATMRPILPRRFGGSPRHARGLSLIEVMVSVLILGIGLLGIAALQSAALRNGQSSLESSQAIMQTTSIIEAMRANRANAGSYNTAGMVCTPPGGGGLVGADLDAWIGSLKTTIGNSSTTCGQITGCPAACVITVRWDDSRAGGGSTRTLQTRTEI